MTSEGTTDCGRSLVEAHAATVSRLVETGRNEMHQEHAGPEVCLSTADAIELVEVMTTEEDEEIFQLQSSSSTTLLCAWAIFTTVIVLFFQ